MLGCVVVVGDVIDVLVCLDQAVLYGGLPEQDGAVVGVFLPLPSGQLPVH